MNTISIVIPNWNGRSLLEKNLSAVVLAQKNKKNAISEILIVDDASTDDSVAYLSKKYKGVVRVIKHKKNLGFAAAVNTGVRHARSVLICLLNTDVVPEKKFLMSVHQHFKKQSTFAVVLHEKGNGPASGSMKDGYLAHFGAPESSVPSFSLWASGGSSVFRRSIWWKLGGLDQDLFHPFYWEDVDLGYRAWKRGYQIIWEPNAVVLHKHEGTINTSSFRKKYMDQIKERNELLFLWKNITSETLFRKHIIGLIRRCLKHPGYVRIVFFAFKKRKMVLKKRAKEAREAVASDEAVFTIFK